MKKPQHSQNPGAAKQHRELSDQQNAHNPSSGTIIVGDRFEDIKDELVMQGCYHLREEQSLICPKCQCVAEGAGHPDPCMRELFGLADEAERGKTRAKGPRVKFACCGHGKDYGYIVFEDGTVVISKTGFEVEIWHKS